MHPPRPATGPLSGFWDAPVSQLVQRPAPAIPREQVERHLIFSLLLMGLVFRYWNGNKRGQDGEYPWRPKQLKPSGTGYVGGDYLGHNIAAIAVNSRGNVLDFDFNHNEILSSSVEHAESRLIRRVFSLTQLYEFAVSAVSSTAVPIPYGNLLNDVTIYTSLESCSQCSGIMALGSVKEVVFLQRDPGQNSIGNILRNLSPDGGRYQPPLPIPADYIGIAAFAALDAAYAIFGTEVEAKPFFTARNGERDRSPSITSFLCTDLARDTFEQGDAAFNALTALQYPEYRPASSTGTIATGTITNSEALMQAKRFYDYAVALGRRGTPHKL